MRPLKTALPLLLALLVSQVHAEKPFAPESIPGSVTVNAEQTVELIQSEERLTIVDSRRFEEYAKGHIEGAVSLLDTDMTEEALVAHAPGRHDPLLFYCNGERCLRSANAVNNALIWGYDRIYWFRGGWQEWADKELPVSR